MGRKEIRQNKLIKFILKQGSTAKDQRELAKKFHVSVRTIQKDMNEIRHNLTKIVLEQSKIKLILRINDRIPDMKNSELIRLLESFFPKKRDAKPAEENQIIVKMLDWSKEREKIERLMNSVKNSKGYVHILNHENEAGQQLESLGGIAATLRFRIM